jgi:spermidine/putrescine transport system ATP-binding protein
MAADALVVLDDVTKRFGDVVAVDGVTLELHSGEFFSLLGPSGCGKTTCLRMISGFDQPTEGRILFEGQDVSHVPPNKRDTNMVFQHLSLFPHMTVRGNIEYGLEKAGVPAEERASKVSAYLDLVDLPGFEDRDPTELSGGQQQRVALARALVNEPSMLLLDEPLSGLDRKLRQHMQVELAKIHRQVEGAFFYVTHDQEVAMTLSDRLAIMRDGRIEQTGTPEEIYRDPVNPFVADFIGDTNLVDGVATSTVDGTVISLGSADGPTLDVDGPAVEGEVTVSIRPESVTLGRANDGLFEAEVVDRFFQGDHTDYVVSSTAEAIGDLNVTTFDQANSFEEGASVSVSLLSDGLRVFEKR